jgi:ADP-ribosylglycohydrolase
MEDYSVSLQEIINRSPKPQGFKGGKDYFDALSAARLFVPRESLEAYRNAAGWKEFARIAALEDREEKWWEKQWSENSGETMVGQIRMITGALAGDIIGSVYEFHNIKSTDFELFSPKTTFTDDSVMTIASMYALLNDGNYAEAYQSFGKKYPNRGYGNRFHYWLYEEKPKPYDSWGNGSAMRSSPAGWYRNTLEEVLSEAEKSAAVSHNHPEGIKGAQATAAAVFLARTGSSKEEIKKYIEKTFGYDLDRKVDDIRPDYQFDESCQGTVPEAIIAFLESTDFENAIRLAISLGGDSDTLACITGAVAEAFYGGVPDHIALKVMALLPEELAALVKKFSWACALNGL